ncbi:MAG: bifunctional DedA family/phosphatase PAP2 family protein [Pseudomonadales bacterium]|nr:bifunctional DedA family/phosphatase PAP2 family protein [Pseudomonadales bacterium]
MFDFSMAELTAWLAAHEQWILVSIAAMAFLESLAIVGIVVPGVAFLFAIAVAAGTVHLPLTSVLIAGFIGAVLGDGISFFLGRHYHHVIRKLPPFSTHPEWITKGELFFERYGLISVVIGRFVGPIRPVMPLIAGMLEMRPSRFLSINAVSAIGWAPMYLLPGYLVGSAAESTTLSQQHFVFIIGALLGGWLFAQIIWWLKSLNPSRALKIKLNTVLFIGSLVMIVALFWWQSTPWLNHLNQQTALWFLSLRHPDLDVFFIGLTALGNYNPMVLWGAAVFLALLIGKNYYLAGIWFSTTMIANGLMQGMKYFFSIERPQLIFDPPMSFAYPSGHTSMVMVFFFLIFVFALPAMNFRWQKPAVSIAIIVATLMALSRLYLGVHWLTDIIGGFLLACFVASGVLMVLFFKPFPAPNPKPILFACIAALALNIGIWVIPNWPQLLESHQPIYSVL